MNARSIPPEQGSAQAIDRLHRLLDLSRKARTARSKAELGFLAVNDTHALHPYRQAALWFVSGGIQALSGVIEPEANAPYAQWLNRLCRHLSDRHDGTVPIDALQLPHDLAKEWAEWLPPHGLWIPMRGLGGLLLAADRPWPDEAQAFLDEWMSSWRHAWQAHAQAQASPWQRIRHAYADQRAGIQDASAAAASPWRRRAWLAAMVVGVMCIPVRLSVLAPGELVPANPAEIRAPLDGVLGQFHVQPNQTVRTGQALFSFDQTPIAARMDVAEQALATAQAEYRQYAQQAVSDARSKPQLSMLLGKIEERRAEAGYLKDQLQRATVTAPLDGIALFDDPSEWTGKPVQTGERIMRIAAPRDVEVEAWVPIGDAIPLPERAQVKLYLAASPFTPVNAQLRYIAHEAVPRPDGVHAYRVRARLLEPATQRVGLRGTVKLSGDSVPLIYWILRRPLATVRQMVGW